MKSLYDILGIHKSSGKRAVNVDKPCEKETSVLKGRFKIQKSEDDKRLALGGRALPSMKTENSLLIGRKI